MKNKTKLTRFFATLRMTSKRAAFTLAEVPEPRQYGSKHELSAVAKVEPEARQRGYKQAAFTLAEVLITLGIIGIVAAMTIPTLVQTHKEKATVARVKQSYSILSQAFLMAVNENGYPTDWDLGLNMYDRNAHINFANYLKPYMKLQEDCVDKPLDYIKSHCINANPYFYGSYYASVVLLNGTVVVFRIWDPKCDGAHSGRGSTTCGELTMLLEPNKKITSGENVFSFYIKSSGIEPWGLPNSGLAFERACNKTVAQPYPGFSDGNMYACAAWVIRVGNMDYLHCNDLSWKGKHKCSD